VCRRIARAKTPTGHDEQPSDAGSHTKSSFDVPWAFVLRVFVVILNIYCPWPQLGETNENYEPLEKRTRREYRSFNIWNGASR
jgi:hypothetical protein